MLESKYRFVLKVTVPSGAATHQAALRSIRREMGAGGRGVPQQVRFLNRVGSDRDNCWRDVSSTASLNGNECAHVAQSLTHRQDVRNARSQQPAGARRDCLPGAQADALADLIV